MRHPYWRLRLIALASAAAVASSTVLVSQVQRVVIPDALSWSGWAQCVLDVRGSDYSHRETHRWMITGAPTMRSTVAVYPARWSVTSGEAGSLRRTAGAIAQAAQWRVNTAPANAELGVTVHADRITVQEISARLVARGGLTGTETTTSGGLARPRTFTLDVDEWRFPRIEDVPTSSRIAGSSTTPFDGARAPMAPAGSEGTATCTWEFIRGTSRPSALPASGLTDARDAALEQARQTDAGAVVSQDGQGSQAAAPRVALGTNPTRTLSTPRPTGPAPSGFQITGTPGVAHLQWNRPADLQAALTVYRASAPVLPEVAIKSCDAWCAGLDDTVPDPRLTYQYRLVVTYGDATWGEALGSFVSPPAVNPAGFRATVVSPGVVRLAWNPAAHAVSYRIDGSGLPITGMEVGGTSSEATISPVPHGVPRWQIAAIYPGNFADYVNRPVASTIDLTRPLPAHAPAWLSKSNGPGSAAETTAHYSRLCGPDPPVHTFTQQRFPDCDRLEAVLRSWGAPQESSRRPKPVKYDNLTDLGSSRETTCYFGTPATGPGALLCYSESDRGVGLIAINNEGARFAVFKRVGDGDAYSDTWGLSERVYTAAFDSEGEKRIPHACLSCHGGTYDPVTGLVKGTSLLPIDPGLVVIKGDHDSGQEQLRGFNAIIRQAYSSQAVAAYIDGLYGGMIGAARGVDTPGRQAFDNYVPQGWLTQPKLYLDIVKKDCAICHLTRADLTFLTSAEFFANRTLIHTAVCKARSMPHAETPFMHFWTSKSGTEPASEVLAKALGFPACSS